MQDTNDRPIAQPPPRKQRLWALTVGSLTFLVTLAACVALTILLIRLIPPDVPNPTDFEGFGDYLPAMMLFHMGAVISFILAAIGGCMVISTYWPRRTQTDKTQQ